MMKQKSLIFGIIVLFVVVAIAVLISYTSDKLPNQQSDLDAQCKLEPETGPCEAFFISYYFDQQESACKEFVWGGCQGVVPFETLEECQEVCKD